MVFEAESVTERKIQIACNVFVIFRSKPVLFSLSQLIYKCLSIIFNEHNIRLAAYSDRIIFN